MLRAVRSGSRQNSRSPVGGQPEILTEIVQAPLDPSRYEVFVARRTGGAVVTFHGVVRDHDGGRSVRGLEYSAHPSAARVLDLIVREELLRCRLRAAAASHRVGTLVVGETAFVVAVCATHRREAFEAAGRIVEETKGRLPVWKRQLFTDGTEEWVHCP
jgi:molybdopterin synthase catalytic subunit